MKILYALALLAAAVIPASADLYSNGPVNGTIGAFPIFIESGRDFAVSDSFVLTSASTITGVDLGTWTDAGASVTNVQWSIGTVQGDNSLGSGVANTTDTFLFPAGNSLYSVDTDSFSTGSINLGPGTYYLTLSNAIATDGGGVYWDVNGGPSSVFCVGGCSSPNIQLADSDSFSVQGTTDTVTPEPGYWVPISVGIVGLIWVRRHRAKAEA